MTASRKNTRSNRLTGTTDQPPAESTQELAAAQEPATKRAADGRPACAFSGCELPEFMENAGLCGGHWATRPDLRKEARRG